MFRDHEVNYLVASVLIVLCLVGLVAWYEIDYRQADSPVDTIISIGYGVGAAVATTITLLATVEVVLVFAERYFRRRSAMERERGREEGRQKGREEGLLEGREEGRERGREEGLREERRAWEEWLQRRERAKAAGEEFNEPSPAQRAADSGSNGNNP